MAIHDYVIDNQSFASYRSDHNSSLQAVVTKNSSATEPTTTKYPYMWWYDTTNNILKFRNADNDAWISFASFDMVNDTVNFLDSTFNQLSSNLASNGFNINFGDSSALTDDRITFGTSNDLQIYHDGSNSYIDDTGAGNLFIQGSNIIHLKSESGASQLAKFTAGGASELYHNGTLTLATTTTGLSVTGGATFTANVDLADSDKLRLGTSQDLEVYHDGSNSYIDDNGSGDLIIRGSTVRLRKTGSTEDMLVANQDGAVELYHNNSKKLETTASGITVTGAITADSFVGVEAGLVKLHEVSWTNSPSSVTISNTYVNSTYTKYILFVDTLHGSQGGTVYLDINKTGGSHTLTLFSNTGNEPQDWHFAEVHISFDVYIRAFSHALTNAEGGGGYSDTSSSGGSLSASGTPSSITLRSPNSGLNSGYLRLYGVQS